MPSLPPSSPNDDDEASLSQVPNRTAASEAREDGAECSSSRTTTRAVPNPTTESVSPVTRYSEIRQTVGGMTVRISDFVNSHLIAVRYGIFSTIALLTAYGLVHSPLFFRYRNVSEIPSRYFQQRRYLHGRLIRCDNRSSSTSNSTKTPDAITCWVRHVSPIERCLSQNILEVLWKWHPTASISRRGEGSDPTDDLMCVQIAGIQFPQYPSSIVASEGENKSSSSSLLFQMSPQIQPMMKISPVDSTRSRIPSLSLLEQLVAQRTPIRMQLLARGPIIPSSSTPPTTIMKKRPLPEFSTATTTTTRMEEHPKLGMVCRFYYREHPFQLFPQDLGMMLVAQGQAVVSEHAGVWWHDEEDEPNTGRSHPPPSSRNGHIRPATSTSAVVVRDDVRYWEQLVAAELRAARESRGIWDDPWYRQSRPEVMTEVEFQTNANVFQKLWRWIRDKRW